MNPGPHRRHSTEFKLQVVKAFLDGEGSLKAVARRYEISHSLLLFWLDKHRQGALTEEDNLLEKIRAYEGKIAALERKVGQLTMELDRLREPSGAAATVGSRKDPTDSDARGTDKESGPE